MVTFTDEQIARYFHRSYAAVDGLWFMKVEEKYGFDMALDIDDEVWKVLPKIQARLLKSMGNLGDGLEALGECLTTRLALEGFAFEMEQNNSELLVTITDCPWHNAMIKSAREHLSERVGSRICTTEYQVLASEFGERIRFELLEQICKGHGCCTLRFRVTE
jgi:hypothetical protein